METMNVMVSVTDKLAAANQELSKEECSLVAIGKLLAEAGKLTKEIKVEAIETIGVAAEFEFLSCVLAEFTGFEAIGAFASEEAAAACIVEQTSIIDLCDKFELSIGVDAKRIEGAFELC